MVNMFVNMMDIPATIVCPLWQKLLRMLLQLAGNFTLILLSTMSVLMTLKLKSSKFNLSSEINTNS